MPWSNYSREGGRVYDRAALQQPRIASALEAHFVRFARENSGWGYDPIVGALANLRYSVS
jgi:hypothetical protein